MIAAHLAILAILGLVIAGTVVFGGLYNVSARLGHLPGVSWVLHTTYHNSVDLYAPPESEVPPDLDDAGRIALGAGHFDQACRFCHASPGEQQSQTAQAMNPRPPHIEEAADHWQPRHFFWIVHEGVKMSGMPQWPTASRDDGVWSVVAFLMAVKEGMNHQQYEALLGRDGPARAMARTERPAAAAPCVTCHGEDGLGRGGSYIPRLDIQNTTYLTAALEAYRSGSRQSGFMAHAASVPEADELAELAAWYGAMPVADPKGEAKSDAALMERGEELAYGRDPKKNVPACVACHGHGEGPKGALFPALSGQYEAYLVEQLHAFRERERGGTDRVTLMKKAAHDLTDGQIDALAAWYAAQPARKAEAGEPQQR
ncbi:hypothetical protein D8780_09615 [Notoacmeibacter ruber]|uniref:Cytochrome c domain-containing protein n=1 Tax=Notoacmeibacter ruber TaxID=2670375 RepID=A0A3L7JFM5_9HYPH|nr:hypothetical protein D8780_09615 [Notoacmeibacter ruber]